MLLEAYHGDLWATSGSSRRGNEYLEWMGLLRSATAFEAYCKVYTADLTPERILEFLLLDEEFPHSVRFSIDSLQCALESDPGRQRRRAARRRCGGLAGRLQASLSYSGVDEILEPGCGRLPARHSGAVRGIHETIYELYVDYSIQAALAGLRR